MAFNDIHIKIKEIRKKLNLSQLEMGEILGIKQSSYSHLESGDTLPTLEHIYIMVKKHNINPLWLFIGIGDMFINNNNAKNITNGTNEGINGDITVNASEHKTLIGEVEFLREELREKNMVIRSLLDKIK